MGCRGGVRKTKQSRCLAGMGVGIPVSCQRRAGVGAFRGAHANKNPQFRRSARSRVGLVTIFGGEFDPGSGSTLAACLMHASRTGIPSGILRGGRVRNTWVTCPVVGGSPRKRGVIPHTLAIRVGMVRKGLRVVTGGACVRLASWWGNGLPGLRSVAGLRG